MTTSLRRAQISFSSHIGLCGRPYKPLAPVRQMIGLRCLTCGIILDRTLPVKAIKVTASVPLNTFSRFGMILAMLLCTVDTSVSIVEAVVHMKPMMSRTIGYCVAISVRGDKSSNLKSSTAPSDWLEIVDRVCKMSSVVSGGLPKNGQ